MLRLNLVRTTTRKIPKFGIRFYFFDIVDLEKYHRLRRSLAFFVELEEMLKLLSHAVKLIWLKATKVSKR